MYVGYTELIEVIDIEEIYSTVCLYNYVFTIVHVELLSSELLLSAVLLLYDCRFHLLLYLHRLISIHGCIIKAQIAVNVMLAWIKLRHRYTNH